MVSLDLAADAGGIVDMTKLDLIKKINFDALHNEVHPTTLCKARWVIKEFITDCHGYGHIGLNLR